jgi:hypothetical protein
LTKPAGVFTDRFRWKSGADADLLDHPVVVTPMLDDLDVAPVMPVMTSIFAPVFTVIVVVVIAVVVAANDDPAVVLVVIVVMAANDDAVVLVVVVGLDDDTCGLRRANDCGRRGQCHHAS